MTVGFSLALVMVLLTLGRDGRWLPVYGVICAFTSASLGGGVLIVVAVVALLVFNMLAWLGLRGFAVSSHAERLSMMKATAPVLAILLMQLVLALSGASLGLVPTLGVGLVLAGLCSAAYGVPLSQFCGLLMAVDGLLVMACVLSSWGLLVMAVALWGVLAVLGATLLPRLAWRRVEDQ
ncbi:hypothetical protein GS501_06915 [Saccharibacter sp. 17.LH.SD]|uniref:hypothetical protein n=1 Tax=Saccharibacter sp. 17.LH.SD TaxID=2689393 RepID=UPI001369F7A5|nr:hypothetical protein [Saccharibacter sp. 17.LH.SD]MXV44766.1 hypothetical protein [Saccharibacter sp. 17.LH.SD]